MKKAERSGLLGKAVPSVRFEHAGWVLVISALWGIGFTLSVLVRNVAQLLGWKS